MNGSDIVYFSDLLPKRHPGFYKRLKALLESRRMQYGLLPDTKDIWCRDYMPVQVSKNEFVQFKFDPSYLHHLKKDLATITDAQKACQSLGIRPVMSDIRIDGGNVVRSGTRVIMTERIFKENLRWSKVKLVKEIEKLLNVKRVIVIPECPGDEVGHADGIVRFIEAPGVDTDTVFVTEYAVFSPKVFGRFMKTLSEEHLCPVILPYDPLWAKNDFDATGIYINYLQVGKMVIFPSFGLKGEDWFVERFERYFGSNAVALRSNEIAEEGGVLNCISWNMHK